jgi:hypothetical protein
MNRSLKPILFLFTGILFCSHISAQTEKKDLRFGFCFLTGRQHIFPYYNKDYNHSVNGYKIMLNYPFKKTRLFSYELHIEPGICLARHQLLNQYYVQPNRGDDYLQQREIFTKNQRINEYVLNIGIIVRQTIKERFSCFVLGSIGPMISDTETERLARGFAFSDVISLGLAYKAGNITFEIRPGIRHVSNANTQYPNSGHNSSNIDFGISVSI